MYLTKILACFDPFEHLGLKCTENNLSALPSSARPTQRENEAGSRKWQNNGSPWSISPDRRVVETCVMHFSVPLVSCLPPPSPRPPPIWFREPSLLPRRRSSQYRLQFEVEAEKSCLGSKRYSRRLPVRFPAAWMPVSFSTKSCAFSCADSGCALCALPVHRCHVKFSFILSFGFPFYYYCSKIVSQK